MYKRMKRLETHSKESQKMNNEMTNLKYAVQETINNVDGLRRRVTHPDIQSVHKKPKNIVPVPVPSKTPKVQFQEIPNEFPTPKKLMIEEVDDDDVDGVSEVIEVEEDSDFDEEESGEESDE
jgi:hypothetical protein